jgi:hypothetical protein
MPTPPSVAHSFIVKKYCKYKNGLGNAVRPSVASVALQVSVIFCHLTENYSTSNPFMYIDRNDSRYLCTHWFPFTVFYLFLKNIVVVFYLPSNLV